MHKVDAWETANTVFTFKKFGTIMLFKPQRVHATRSSFYLIVQDVQVDNEDAIAAVTQWKIAWKDATFGGPDSVLIRPSRDEVTAFVTTVAKDLINIRESIWETQRGALAKTRFIQEAL